MIPKASLALLLLFASQAAQSGGALSFYQFSGNGDDASGHGHDFITHHAVFLNDALRVNGIYDRSTPDGYRAQTPNIPELNYSNFTIATDFNTDADAASRPIVVGGIAYRWIEVRLSRMSQLEVALNNDTLVYPSGRIIQSGRWYNVAVALDLNAGKVRLSLDRQTVLDRQLPAGFRLEIINSPAETTDKVISLENYANGTAFKGMIRNLAIYPGTIVFPAAPPAVSSAPPVAAPPAPDTTRPTLISKVEPNYTDAARAAKYSGSVLLEAVVRKDGTPDAIQVVRAAGFGLDEEAIAAIKQWRFKPATRNGEPVDFKITMEVNFNLK
jgi:TonB family protein